MKAPEVGSIMTYVPGGCDLFDDRLPFESGDQVLVVQPLGYPPNGTLGQCYVKGPDSGHHMVLVASLHPARTES
ncbi:MAG: hypothetical protein ACYDEA_08035 [Candidatus Dormibacteria bacterium]